MANTYTALHYHVVFSTKNRAPLLTPPIRARLHPYLAAITRDDGLFAREIGGVQDHVHALVDVPARISVADAIKLLKGGSSPWIKTNFPELRGFAWQDGYGAFTVSNSDLDAVRTYIRNQEEHHRIVTFAEEYRLFLAGHRVPFDERYLLG